jgi:hypothetical protein
VHDFDELRHNSFIEAYTHRAQKVCDDLIFNNMKRIAVGSRSFMVA